MSNSLQTDQAVKEANNTAQVAFIATKLAKNLPASELASLQARSDLLEAENVKIASEIAILSV